DDSEWSGVVSDVLEVGFQLLEWPQPLLQLIHGAEISCEMDGGYELVIVLRMEIIREPRFAQPLTQSWLSQLCRCLREIGASGCGMRQFRRKTAHGSYCACPSVLSLNCASDSS